MANVACHFPCFSRLVVKNLVFSKAYVPEIDSGVRQLEPNRGRIVGQAMAPTTVLDLDVSDDIRGQ